MKNDKNVNNGDREEIYKMDTKGRLRYIAYWTERDILVQESGLVDGKGKEDRKQCYPKNIGKSNETTGAQQAILEMEAKIEKKLKTEYFRTKQEAQNQKVILPMLAKNYEDEKHKIDGYSAQHNTFMQRKLDGFRCVAIVENGSVTLMSRSNREIENMNHIKTQLALLKNGVYDGELYKHGLTFQEISRLIKKYRAGESETMEYHMYDMQSSDSFYVRHLTLNRNFVDAIKAGSNIPNLVLVPTTKVLSQSNIEILHSIYVDEGYEGAIIRWGNAPYKTNGRSDNLLKVKMMDDDALEIIDVVPQEANPQLGQVIVRLKNGQSQRCGMKGGRELEKTILANKTDYIGKLAEVRYFGFTDDGQLRHAQYYGLRHDK